MKGEQVISNDPVHTVEPWISVETEVYKESESGHPYESEKTF